MECTTANRPHDQKVGNTLRSLGDFIREMNFAPTLKGKIPTDLWTNSVSVHDIDEDDLGLKEALDNSMAEWIRAVKPIETLEFTVGNILPAIYEGINRLREERIWPTILCGNPACLSDIVDIHLLVRGDNINDRCEKGTINIEHADFYDNEFLDYSDGLYLFSDMSALLYRTDKMNAYWNVVPMTVHLVKKEE